MTSKDFHDAVEYDLPHRVEPVAEGDVDENIYEVITPRPRRDSSATTSSTSSKPPPKLLSPYYANVLAKVPWACSSIISCNYSTIPSWQVL